MKLIELHEAADAESSVTDLAYDKNNSNLSNVNLFNVKDFIRVAPNGERVKVWEAPFVIEHKHNVSSLEGSPIHCKKKCEIHSRILKSLEGAPEIVDAMFYIDAPLLTDLKGGPKEVQTFIFYGDLDRSKLTSLEGSPEKCQSFSIEHVKKLSSLKGITPNLVELKLDNCVGLKSFKDIHKHVKSLKKLFLINTIPSSHILGLLLINGLSFLSYEIDDDVYDDRLITALDIIKKHLHDKDILACQTELIEKDLDEYAQL